MRFNIGCGRDVRPGWVNIDVAPGPGVTVHDLTEPLPYADACATMIYASHVFEHVANWTDLLYECHRMLKPGCELVVRVPYGINADPFHLRFFWPATMNTFCQDTPGNATSLQIPQQRMFDLVETRVHYVVPFAWHLGRYLKIHRLEGMTWPLPVGKRHEIEWVMRKVGR